jgi:hypothetical protein
MESRRQGVAWFDGPPDGLIRSIVQALAADRNVLLYGPPGTGKTWAMLQVRRYFLNPTIAGLSFDPAAKQSPFADVEHEDAALAPSRPQRRVWWTTFHQSYGYEEFVLGLRPVGASTGVTLVPRPGPFLEAAEFARDSNSASAILIDEVNRANASRTFGELVTLLEPDKRLDETGSDTDSTVTVRLPYLDAPFTWTNEGRNLQVVPDFTLPAHVFMLASMNSVDRSVAPLDSALRRRFKVVEVQPDYDLLASKSGASWDDLSERRAVDAADWAAIGIEVLRAVNVGIRSTAGDDFELGHAYLWPLVERGIGGDVARERLEALWDTKILPQVIELFRSQPEQLAAVLGSTLDGVPLDFPYRLLPLPPEFEALGALPAVATPTISGLGVERVEDVLRWIARRPMGVAHAEVENVVGGDETGEDEETAVESPEPAASGMAAAAEQTGTDAD